MSETLETPPWYALQIRSRFEKVVVQHLTHKGYEAYLPLVRSSRRWSDRIKIVELPLFTGYVFCKLDIGNRHPVLLVPGVLSIVGTGKIPAAIPDYQISALRQVITSGMQYGPYPFVQPGQTICIDRGPLAGLTGTLIEVKSRLRLIVSLPLLQRSVAVEISRHCVAGHHASMLQSSELP